MLKDFFQRNIEIMNELRSQHFKYTQYLSKGKYKLKQKFFGKGKKHYDFDINSQEYFHQQIQDIAFQSSQAQDQFFNLVLGAINRPLNVKNNLKYSERNKKQQMLTLPLSISNPSQCRVLLSKHFFGRVYNLKYKKYMILSRYHNSDYQKKEQELLPFVQSRTQIIDKQIQVAMNRQIRLGEEDYFEESYTKGGKPVPISQTGQPIYKYLDQQQCWYSNISREDIIVYTRNTQFKRELLNECYYPIESELKSIAFRDGLQILLNIEEDFEKNAVTLNKQVAKMAEQFNSLVERQLQKISPGNLVQKENLNSFGYTIFGLLSNSPLRLPLYPAIYPQLLSTFSQSSSLFFKNLQFKSHQHIISLLPKLNSFCQILFKYQNHEVLEGKKEIKLGLQDDIDVKKQLYTMLEQVWVRKHINLPFERFDYKLELKSVDWPLDSISEEVSRQNTRNKTFQRYDTSTQELIKMLDFNDFVNFRKHMKKRSQKIVSRAQSKYFDMENINHFNKKSNQKMTLQQLSQMFKIKFDKSPAKEPFLKPLAQTFFTQIIKKHLIINPAEVQIQEILRFLSIREDKVKVINILNGLRCYHRNLCLDLRVLTGEEFKFKLDDDFLINSNKQVVQNFEKAIKQTATFFTKNSTDKEGKVNEQFYLPESNYERSMLYKKDIIKCNFYNNSASQESPKSINDLIPHVLVLNGKRRKSSVLYGVVIQNDLPIFFNRVLENATKIINQFERYIKITSREEIVDRVELLRVIVELQLKYLYNKFRLVEKYYYLYENTTSILDAFKISKIIVQLIYRQPAFDIQSLSKRIPFQQIYENQIQALGQEQGVLQKIICKLKNQEQRKVQTFHKRFCQMSKVPLSAQVYLYRDLEPKQRSKNRLQRINSMSSKMSSKSSKANYNKNSIGAKQQIREQFDEDDSGSDKSFDIQNYDQYLLKKDMDAIFDDMIQVEDNKDSVPINTASQQNIVINPRFEGGPHPYNYMCDQIQITSQKKENVLNFFETLAFAANVRQIIKSVQNQFIHQYGHVSKMYQTYLIKAIGQSMNRILLQPLKSAKKWRQFESYDPYHEIVTQSLKHYQELMAPAIQPPSNIQMAIASTLEKHQQKLHPFSTLSILDYYSIESLIFLKKPINTASYRQLALGINFLTFLNIRQSLFHIQLKRQRIIETYEKLASNCGSVAQRYGAMYSRSGQSDIFLSIQQIRLYKDDQYVFPVFPELIQQLNTFIMCQKADVQLFETIVTASKITLEDYIIMKNEVGRDFLNSRFDNDRLLAKDQKTIKMIKNRLSGQISNICQEQFKRNSFLKIKQQLKMKVQKSIKQASEADLSSKLSLPKQKISEYCKSLLEDKLKRKLMFEVVEAYQKDLIDTNMRNKVFVETDFLIKRLRKLINSAPYLKKMFAFSSNEEILDKKVFYDQKKSTEKQTCKHIEDFVVDGKVNKPFFIYSRQQLCEQWGTQQTLFRSNNLNEWRIHQIDFHPPKQKEDLFRWLYKIPNYSFSEHEEIAFQHFITKLCLPFTGKVSQSEYIQKSYDSEPPRNRFNTIFSYYQTLLGYLEMNYLLITLQMEDDVLESFNFLLQNDDIVFEEAFPLKDEVSIHQSLENLQKKYLKTCFNYRETREADKNQIKKKIDSKGYAAKKEHWTVFDEIIDFIVSKIQGRGIIRQNFLPFTQELQKILNASETTKDVQQIMKKKTEQITHYFVLSTFEAYLNEQHQNSQKESTFWNYLFSIQKWFLGNGLQQFRLVSPFSNSRYNIAGSVSLDDKQMQRFILGVSNKYNDHVAKMSSILEKYKPTVLINSIDFQAYVEQILKSRLKMSSNKSSGPTQTSKNYNTANSTGTDGQLSQFTQYNMDFLPQGIQLFSLLGEQNRLKIFTRMRFYYQKTNEYMKIKSMVSRSLEIEETKLNYIKFLYTSKSLNYSTVIFTSKPSFPISSKAFKQVSTQLKQQIQINTFTIMNKFEQYKAENKIQFGKSEVKLLSTTEELKKDQKVAVIYNNFLKEIIQAKLTRQEFKARALNQSIKILRNQKLQQAQPKKIINTSLIPRVHLIASYSSPLIMERKTFISQQYKLAFAQAFINRFRNKVSRVDLLSSGYGFVITVPDLEDCVNFMNKLLFTFAQKEFKYRLQTNQQYFEIMVQAVNEKNKVINEQQEIIKYLQQKVSNIMEAQYLGKVTKLLHQKTVIEDKLKAIQQSTNGLEDRVRKTVQIQYEKKITSLQTQNQLLKNKFNEFKELFVILTKDSAKNNFLNVANTIRQKISDLLNKRIDVKESFLTSEQVSSKQKQTFNVKEQQIQASQKIKRQQNISSEVYSTSDLQKCKLGEDIVHDPYYVTKLITKMRLFNIFKMGCKRISFEQIQTKKASELKQLHRIQDNVIAQSERQILIRQQLKKTQQDLSRKVAQLDKLKQSYELLDNQRTKLKILLAGKDKKIQQKERQAVENMKKLQQIQKLPMVAGSQSKIDKVQDDRPKLSELRKIHKKKSIKIQKSPFLTSVPPVEPSISVYERFQLSNKDATWRQKCEQLYIENKKLLNQLQKAQSALTTPTRQGYSLNLRQRKNSESFNHGSDNSSMKKEQQQKRFPNLSFKYNLMKQPTAFNP